MSTDSKPKSILKNKQELSRSNSGSGERKVHYEDGHDCSQHGHDHHHHHHTARPKGKATNSQIISKLWQKGWFTTISGLLLLFYGVNFAFSIYYVLMAMLYSQGKFFAMILLTWSAFQMYVWNRCLTAGIKDKIQTPMIFLALLTQLIVVNFVWAYNTFFPDDSSQNLFNIIKVCGLGPYVFMILSGTERVGNIVLTLILNFIPLLSFYKLIKIKSKSEDEDEDDGYSTISTKKD